MSKIHVYDTTLRDGAQAEEIGFSLEDKLAIARLLDAKVDFIEGGFPAPGNTKDSEFYQRMKKQPLRHAQLVAFGSTRRAKHWAESDPGLLALLDTGAPAVALVGKTWPLHVRDVLRIPLEENLKIVRESVAFIKSKKRLTLFDAEHFFDAYRSDPAYTRAILESASAAGADWIVLCDTNGGTLPDDIAGITQKVRTWVRTPIGIHAHNDSELAVANSLAAVRAGADMVQGTVNGYGERCGNANLCSVIPNLQLKMGRTCMTADHLKQLTNLSRTVSEIANLAPREQNPYVGYDAFAHKGGLHVDAVRKNPKTYEHVPPAVIGNTRRIIISEQAGVASILFKAEELGIKLTPGSDQAKSIIERIKDLEHAGYKFEGADGSFRLLVQKSLKQPRRFFTLEGYRVIVEHRDDRLVSEATIKLVVGAQQVHAAAEGDGPVNALDSALRKALEPHYPALRTMKLVDFKVRVLDSKTGTGTKVRVFIESRDGRQAWGTVGVSSNIIEAAWEALVDSVDYKLHADRGWK